MPVLSVLSLPSSLWPEFSQHIFHYSTLSFKVWLYMHGRCASFSFFFLDTPEKPGLASHTSSRIFCSGSHPPQLVKFSGQRLFCTFIYIRPLTSHCLLAWTQNTCHSLRTAGSVSGIALVRVKTNDLTECPGTRLCGKHRLIQFSFG